MSLLPIGTPQNHHASASGSTYPPTHSLREGSIIGLCSGDFYHYCIRLDFSVSSSRRIMRSATRLMMASAMSTRNGLKAKPMALLPPIPLYRRLLRAHRKYLPQEMRLLGDEYIKAEFRAHREVDNPVHIVSAVTASGYRLSTHRVPDWILNGVANVCPENRGGLVGRRETRLGQN